MTAPRETKTDGKAERQRFATFVLTGGVAAGVNVVARILLSQVMRYGAAVAVAYLAGMTTAFILARLFVFKSTSDKVFAEFLRFGVVNIAAFVQVWLVSVALAEYVFPHIAFTWHAETIAHVIGVASPVVMSYYAHKYFSFGHKQKSKIELEPFRNEDVSSSHATRR